jgi:uncharacterized protein with FMN-binding domain
MKKKVVIVASATFGLGLSLLLAQTIFSNPESPFAKNDLSLATLRSGDIYTGPSIDVRYGRVRVEIRVLAGQIIHVRALEEPVGRSSQYSQYAIPVLQQQTLAAQSADIQGASGASFTSYGWKTSLQAAIKSAKL